MSFPFFVIGNKIRNTTVKKTYRSDKNNNPPVNSGKENNTKIREISQSYHCNLDAINQILKHPEVFNLMNLYMVVMVASLMKECDNYLDEMITRFENAPEYEKYRELFKSAKIDNKRISENQKISTKEISVYIEMRKIEIEIYQEYINRYFTERE